MLHCSCCTCCQPLPHPHLTCVPLLHAPAFLHEHSSPHRTAPPHAGSTPPGLTARSVLGVAGHACSAGCGHAGHLLAFGGEIDPSDKGHEGAGQFSGETFCYDVAGGSGGSVQQGCGGHGHGAHSRGWCKLAPGGEGPGPRGWFATATLPDGSMVVHGGINDGNDRLADMYRLDMHA